MNETIESPLATAEKSAITFLRHVRSYSVEITDGSTVITRTTGDAAMAEIMTRLYYDLVRRFALPEIQEILAIDPNRKMALRVSLQLIDEGASDREIRQAAHHELAAFDDFVERERPKLLKPEKVARPQ